MALDLFTQRCFLHLATHLHFGKTAKALYVSTPTVSRMVKLLEAELGVVLFVRNRQSVVLTPSGDEFKRYCEQEVERHEDLLRSLKALEGVVAGRIRIAASATGAYGIVAPKLKNLKKRYPKIDLELRLREVGKIYDALLEGEVDLSVTSHMHPTKGISQAKVTDLKLVMVMPNDWNAMPHDLNQETFLVPASGSIRAQILEWFEAQNIAPTLYDDSQGFEGILTLACLGYGIGILPEMVIEESRLKDHVQVITPSVSLPQVKVSAFAKTASLQNPALRVVWDLLTD